MNTEVKAISVHGYNELEGWSGDGQWQLSPYLIAKDFGPYFQAGLFFYCRKALYRYPHLIIFSAGCNSKREQINSGT